MTYPSGMPIDQQNILTQLSGSGGLEGINPDVLAAIDQWESDFEIAGAGVNSSGYGGYFGLGTSPYPGGTLTDTDLETSSDAEFSKQAAIAASEVNSLLQQNSGNLQAAMNAYDGGSSAETNSVIAAAGGNPGGEPGDIQGGSGAVTTAPASSVAARTALGGSGNILQEIDALLNPSGGGFIQQLTTLGTSDMVATVKLVVFRGLFTVFFAGIAIMGVKMLGAPGTTNQGPSLSDKLNKDENKTSETNNTSESSNTNVETSTTSAAAAPALDTGAAGELGSGAAETAGEATAGFLDTAAEGAVLLL